MNRLPLITVYVATHNRAAVLPRALRSVWQQQATNYEIVVVDDASQDGTPKLLDGWAREGKLRWFRNQTNLGACASRNLALRHARGRFVTGLDDDDEMLPGRLASLLSALEHGDAFVCASDVLIDSRGESHFRICPKSIDAPAILARNVVGNQILAERVKLLACGGFDESLPSGQDYDMWIRMVVLHGPARGISTILQRIHTGASDRISVSPRRQRGYLTVYRKHKALMSMTVRAIHLYNLHKSSGKRLSLSRGRAFFVAGNRLRVLLRLLSERLPVLTRPAGRLAERYLIARK